VRLSRCEVRDHINYRKNDRWRSYRFYRGLQRLEQIARMSPFGTFRTWRDVRLESVMRSKPDIGESNVATCLKELRLNRGRPMGVGERGFLTRRGRPLISWRFRRLYRARNHPVSRGLGLRKCLKGVRTDRAGKAVGLAWSGVKFRAFVKCTALADDLRGCHSGLGRPTSKGSGNNSQAGTLDCATVKRKRHPKWNNAPLPRESC
jgi:hypothetical protein